MLTPVAAPGRVAALDTLISRLACRLLAAPACRPRAATPVGITSTPGYTSE
jgi:hypothetical protein